ncbi:amidase family protein [Caulobacter mirabilis]|nr:amidase family protein [Caulobacter mirabilis]
MPTYQDPSRRSVLKVGSALAVGGVLTPLQARAADDWADLDATGMAEQVRAGAVSPLELLDAAIARAEAVNGRLNLFSEKLYDQARARAAGMETRGAFAGVPYLLKDETELAGSRLHLGSKIDAVMPLSTRTDPTIARMEAAGFNVFGRTTMSEFGALPTTETAAYGVTRNPWSLDHTPGGSSGGAAAAVAAGIVPMADAWDGAGSIRIPASNCGLVGLKPTRGRTTGSDKWFPELSLASHFCVSRSVRDSANLLALVESEMEGLPAVGRVQGPSRRRLRIGVTSSSLSGRSPSPDVAAAMAGAVRLLEGLGHQVREAVWPLDTRAFQADFTQIYLAYGDRMADRLAAHVNMSRKVMIADVEPASRTVATMGRMISEAALRKVLSRVSTHASAYYSQFAGLDVVMSPVLLTPPVGIGVINGSVPLGDLAQRLTGYADYTMLQNAVGGPAISLPLHQSSTGLPIGLQFAADRGGERTLLELAFELEQARPWAKRRPPVWPA